MVLASGNRGKLAEFTALLSPYGVNVEPLSRFAAHGPEETGASFLENALLKARAAASVAHVPAIADDSGLEVDALHGAPGIFSARFAGAEADEDANNRKLIEALQGIAAAQRSARFRCVLVYVRTPTDHAPIIAEGVWEGRILESPQGDGGFGYDPLFLPRGLAVSAAEMSAEEKNRLSHRGQATGRLLQALIVSGAIGAATARSG